MRRAERKDVLLERLPSMYPDARCLLEHGGDPFRLLVATVLAARTTDEAVNRVIPELFREYPGPGELASADAGAVEEIVHPLGFFRAKTRSILGAAARVRDYGGVPDTMEELVQVPGVGRKTANVVLAEAFGRPAVIVDTHVGRLSRRLDLTRKKAADDVELVLRELLPEESWTSFSHQLGFHGRRVCTSRRPGCGGCGLLDVCPRRGLEGPVGEG